MRSLISRRGTTAIELLLVLLLFVGFAAALHALVRLAGTESRATVQRAVAARDQVALWALLSHDLAHPTATDVTVVGSNALEFDRPVGEGLLCASEPFAALLRTNGALLLRQPAAGRDHLWLREPGPGGTWARRGIVSVAVANCPDGGSALRLTLDAAITPSAFARSVEPVRLRSYRSEGVYALGLEGRGGGATIQPLAGPLDATAFQALVNGDLLRVTLSRVPLVPMQLNLPLRLPP